MDNLFAFTLIIPIAAFSTVGIISLVTDNRHFSHIESQCKQQGYIQNNTTRIMCKVEEKNCG